MMRLRRTAILSLFCLTSYVASASAECAWVLWTGAVREVSSWWQVSAHQTEAECWARITSVTFVPREDSWTATFGWVFQTQPCQRWAHQWQPNGVRVTSSLGVLQYKRLPETMTPPGVERSR